MPIGDVHYEIIRSVHAGNTNLFKLFKLLARSGTIEAYNNCFNCYWYNKNNLQRYAYLSILGIKSIRGGTI